MQRLPPQLIANRFDDLWMTVADVKDAKAAQAVQIRVSEYVAVGVRPGIRPFNNRAGLARIGRFPVFEKSGINVIAERVDRFASDPRCFGGSDVGFRDQRQNALRVFVDGSFSLSAGDRHPAKTCAAAAPNIAKPSSSSLVADDQRNEYPNNVALSRQEEQKSAPASLLHDRFGAARKLHRHHRSESANVRRFP